MLDLKLGLSLANYIWFEWPDYVLLVLARYICGNKKISQNVEDKPYLHTSGFFSCWASLLAHMIQKQPRSCDSCHLPPLSPLLTSAWEGSWWTGWRGGRRGRTGGSLCFRFHMFIVTHCNKLSEIWTNDLANKFGLYIQTCMKRDIL